MTPSPPPTDPASAPLALPGVVHLLRPSGPAVEDLAGLRAAVAAASPASLFHHVHHPLLRHAYGGVPAPDDYSAWVGGVLQDRETAERLSYAAQAHGAGPDELRDALLAALPAAGAAGAGAHADAAFAPLEMDRVDVDLGLAAHDADELVELLCGSGAALFFHHVIERPWFDPHGATVAGWAEARGAAELGQWLRDVPRSGRTLEDSRRRLLQRWRRSRVLHAITGGADEPEGVRQARARRAVTGLVERLHGGADR